jgi:hypothetical protein
MYALRTQQRYGRPATNGEHSARQLRQQLQVISVQGLVMQLPQAIQRKSR